MKMADILIRKQYFCKDKKLRLPTKEVVSELPFSVQDFDNFVDWIGRELIHNTSGFKDHHGIIRKSINEIYKCVRDNGFLDQYLILHFDHIDNEKELYPIVLTHSSIIWDQKLSNTKSNDDRVAIINNFQKRLLRIQLLREFSNDQNSVEDNKRYGDFDRLLYMMSTGMEFNLEIYDLKRPSLFGKFNDPVEIVNSKGNKQIVIPFEK